MNNLDIYKKEFKYGVEHVHSDNSVFDSSNTIFKIINFCKENNIKNITLTDHGVMTGIDDFMYACKDADINGIPGCEMYIKNANDLKYSHILVIAKNMKGYKELCLAVTESNKTIENGIPVIDKKVFSSFFSNNGENVIVTSACVGGIFATILNKNIEIEEKIKNIENATKGLKTPEDKDYIKICEELKQIEDSIKSLKDKKTVLKKNSSKTFKKEENALKKLTGNEYDVAYSLLTKKKEDAKKDKLLIPTIENEINALTTKKTLKNNIRKDYENEINRYKTASQQIEYLKKQIKKDLVYEVKKEAEWYKKNFVNFYMEMQYHHIPLEKQVMPVLANIAKELNIPVIASNDVHLITKEDAEARDLLKYLRFNKDYSEPSIGEDELYFKNDYELASVLSEILPDDVVNEAMSNLKILSECKVEFTFEKHYPVFDKKKDSNKLLREFCYKNIEWRYPDRNDFDKTRQERLEYELGVITKMGYSDYFLIVQDFLDYGRQLGFVSDNKINESPLDLDELKKWVKDNNWNVGVGIGPGRGSAVGSIVSYLLGITDIDPITYDLLFERFLNTERVSMPDIDSDFKTNIRDRVIEYVKAKYGYEAVCCIITKGTQAVKGSIRNAARFLGAKKYGNKDELLSIGDKIAKAVPNTPGIKFKDEDCKKSLEPFIDEDEKDIIRLAKLVEGTITSYGMHAAGVIISDNNDVKQYTPLRWNNKKKRWTTQCDKEQAEMRGLLKMDFLGLKNLNIITDTFKYIYQRHNKVIDVKDIKFEKEVFKDIFSTGLTTSVFQVESAGMKDMLKKFKPTTIEDLILLIAVYRPGPMKFLNSIIEVKNGTRIPEYILPELEEILGKTYGYPVYQEQIMQIFNKVAGFSLSESDIVRRLMSKKKTEKFIKYKDRFIEGLLKKGADKEKSLKFWDDLVDFSKYAFNKSHACAYAHICYYTAWLKKYYTIEYMTAMLNHTEQKKLIGIINDAKTFKINVKNPNVNISVDEFSIYKNDIIFGLSGIKNVGNAAKIIYEEKKKALFTSFKDFVLRCAVDKQVIESLVYAGALDDLLPSRLTGIAVIENLMKERSVIQKKKNFIIQANNTIDILKNYDVLSVEDLKEISKKENISIIPASDLKKMPTTESLKKRITNAEKAICTATENFNNIPIIKVNEKEADKLKKEKEYTGSYISAHPLDEYVKPDKCENIEDLDRNKEASIYGIISDYNLLHRKSDGKDMCSFKIEDKTSSIDAIVFTNGFASFGSQLKEDEIYIFNGKVEIEEFKNVDDEDDENGEINIKRTFQVSSIETLSPNKTPLILDDVDIFDIESSEFSKKISKYLSNNGRKLMYIDFDNQLRETIFCVSESIKNDKYFTFLNENVL